MTKLQKLQKKVPKALKSLDAKLKSAPVAAGNAGRARWRGIVGGVDLSFGKTQSVLACFHVPSAILTDLAAGGGLFELTAELHKFGAHEVRFGRLVTR
jgi:hypothetical protein